MPDNTMRPTAVLWRPGDERGPQLLMIGGRSDRNSQIYDVNDDFPKIIKEKLDQAITAVKYSKLTFENPLATTFLVSTISLERARA